MEILLGKGRLVKAIVTVFSTLTVNLQFDNQVDVAVTDCRRCSSHNLSDELTAGPGVVIRGWVMV